MKITAFGLVALFLATPAMAQDRQEIRFIKQLFGQLQERSIKENREYCGYIGYNDKNRLAAGKVVRGRKHSCEAQWPEELDVVASFHTHAAYELDAQSEVPSVNDMEADESEGIDGYVATPGGRLWYIDTEDMIASQICGIGCLLKDKRFKKGVDGRVEQSYTYEELVKRENDG